MFIHNIDPVLFSIGPIAIRYYGIIYALGFLMAYYVFKKASEKKIIPWTQDDLERYMLWLMIGVVSGARIFEILFYHPHSISSNPLEMVQIWHGGLSFHGGLVGAFLITYLFARKKNIAFLQLADILVLPAALALALGRIANFINGEVYGIPTNLPWAVQFPTDPQPRHPSQIYEAIKNMLIFSVLLLIQTKKPRQGIVCATFFVLYGTVRFFIEFVKEPEMMVGPLTMGQVLSIPMVIGGIWLFYYLFHKKSVS